MRAWVVGSTYTSPQQPLVTSGQLDQSSSLVLEAKLQIIHVCVSLLA